VKSVGERPQSFGEEIANSATHGFGVLTLCMTTPFLLNTALHEGGPLAVVSASIFAGTSILLYLVSTAYHAKRPGRLKQWLQKIDHAAIFLLIAGTYTPFSLGALRGPWGWSLFGVVWGLAVAGIGLEAIGMTRYRILAIAIYLVMGWLVMVAVVPLVKHVPATGLVLLLAGGLSYTIGVPFYVAERLRYSHTLWHLFVLAGTACHFLAVMHYAV
jgi:hemolysin III